MTRVIKREYVCPKCGTKHEILEVMSVNSRLPIDVAEIQEGNKCPNCQEPYKWGEAFRQKENPASNDIV